MNLINKVVEKCYNDYYKSIYKTILENSIENEKICIINQNYFNPFSDFSHFMKKFNVMFYILFKHKENRTKFINLSEGEELQENVCCDFEILEDIKKLYNFSKFSKIILFDIKSESYLNDVLEIIYPLVNEQTKIYIYISLTNKSSTTTQSSIRNFINIYSYYKISNIMVNNTFFDSLHKNKLFSIDKIKIFRDNYYMIYGENTIYEIILTPNL